MQKPLDRIRGRVKELAPAQRTSQYLSWISGTLAIAGLIALIQASWELTLSGNYRAGSSVANIVLVIITGFYVALTYLLVKENRAYREQQEEFREDDRERKKDRLRKALLAELRSMDELENYPPENLTPTTLPMFSNLPTTVYDSNTDLVGLLTSEEIDAIVRFYSGVQVTSQEIEASMNLGLEIEFPQTLNFTPLHQQIKLLKKERSEAIMALENNINNP